MTSATLQRLFPDQPAGAQRARDHFESGEDNPESPQLGLIATLLAQGANILSSNGERERTQRNAIIAFAMRCLSAALLYASQIVLARWMGGHEYGIYVFVWTWVLILGGMSHLGLNVTAMRMAPTYRETGELSKLRGLVRGTRLMSLATSTVVMLVGVTGVYLFQDYVLSHYVLPLYLALVCVPLFALTDVQDGIGRGNAWMGVALAPPYVLRPVFVLLTMIGAYSAGLPMQATTAAGAAIIATWGAGLIQSLMINRRLSISVPNGRRVYDFKGWFSISLPLLVIQGCELALQNTDLLVISHFMTPTDVGIYFAAGKTMALIMFVHYAVGSAVANKFAALHARGDRESLRSFVTDAVNWTFWPSLAGAILILALGKPLLWLFGPQFEAGYPVMCILVAGFLFRSSMGPAEFLLNMLGEQALCATVLFSAAMLDIVLNFALVPRYGLVGAATATSVSLMMAALMNYIVVWRRLGIEIAIWRNIPKF
ncbi:MAG: lipopolysaccharide biosynthesis protein [Hyphomicrobium sp.]